VNIAPSVGEGSAAGGIASLSVDALPAASLLQPTATISTAARQQWVAFPVRTLVLVVLHCGPCSSRVDVRLIARFVSAQCASLSRTQAMLAMVATCAYVTGPKAVVV
jgi:hypothetical protein